MSEDCLKPVINFREDFRLTLTPLCKTPLENNHIYCAIASKMLASSLFSFSFFNIFLKAQFIILQLIRRDASNPGFPPPHPRLLSLLLSLFSGSLAGRGPVLLTRVFRQQALLGSSKCALLSALLKTFTSPLPYQSKSGIAGTHQLSKREGGGEKAPCGPVPEHP